MKRTIVAILALTPGVLLAQAHTPAQPSSTPVLQSALLQPVAFPAGKASNTASADSSTARISTGVVAPALIHQADLAAIRPSAQILTGGHTVVVEMTVDASGKPTDLRLVQSFTPAIDEQVLATVSQFRYRPGTLNGQPTAFPVKLEYTIETPSL